ncbi:trans-aconitate 2-methyltransferase [Aaosphaeria arxii CBS 175.79]|uniref:Trans-aconitate 2-methyltransferase n=1 Tax=Aaosphaeria arxii CBS 175.79 TaxID=1450172 RepID=A0A6A5Y4E2_9PLEO|nr:trans-aconitate 2-methyltransferase [Aaosphaeria arxii CBS 175.79]KAF2019897.1 trans-aconitate 2-methyltransferase [Aaosphaeria arxii CBS 175.79]
MSQAQEAKKHDWSATKYMKYGNERTRPVNDLVAQVIQHFPAPPTRIYDLGCGPGNSTSALLSAFPDAKATGIDTSPDMLEKARAALPNAEFIKGDIGAWTLPSSSDQSPVLVFSNAAVHWLRSPKRLETVSRVFNSLPTGSVIAIQVPDNYDAPTHSLMRAVASEPSKPWSKYFTDVRIGDLADKTRPDLDPIEAAESWYNVLVSSADTVNIWRTEYKHVIKDARGIVDWVATTGLGPYLVRMEGDEEAKVAFEKEYERRLSEVYTKLEDGKVLLGYPRLFVLARRK